MSTKPKTALPARPAPLVIKLGGQAL